MASFLFDYLLLRGSLLLVQVGFGCVVVSFPDRAWAQQSKTSQQEVSEPFAPFLIRFYNDRAFQLSRISPRLTGYLRYTNDKDKLVTEQWPKGPKMEVVSADELKRQLKGAKLRQTLTCSSIFCTQRLEQPDSGFWTERTFRLHNYKWVLFDYKFVYL